VVEPYSLNPTTSPAAAAKLPDGGSSGK
jgi:hypothetical protein